MDLDKDLIRELAALLEETGLSEIEIGEDDKHIRVARGGTSVVSAVAPAPAVAAAAPAEPEGRGPVDLASHPGAVTSPMVGTAYMSPDPNSPSFVSVGDTVKEGQTLLIVEAMKTMNAIPAPRAGKVIQILVTNEQPVEYDEVLMIIE
jgi:acetyl-CoA carboxylase biotin carboxyl carrier protein